MAKRKLIRFAELETFDNVYQPKYEEISGGEYCLKGKWAERVFGNNNPIVLEIGCGKGEYTVGLARLFPDKNFIGIDIKGARIWRGAKTAIEEKIPNVAFLRAFVEQIDAIFAEGEVDEMWITFPDPQMNKARKRLTGSKLLAQYRKYLKPNGLVHLKTDSGFLYQYTIELIKKNGMTCNVDNNDLYLQGGADDKILSIRTFYEQQWLNRGKTIKYVQFMLDGSESIEEPDVDIEKDDYHSQSQYMSVVEE